MHLFHCNIVGFVLAGLLAFLAVEPVQPAPSNQPNGLIYYKPLRNEYVQSWRPAVYRSSNYRAFPHYNAPLYNYQARPIARISQPYWPVNRWTPIARSRYPVYQPLSRPMRYLLPSRPSLYTPGRHLVGTTLSPSTSTSSIATTTSGSSTSTSLAGPTSPSSVATTTPSPLVSPTTEVATTLVTPDLISTGVINTSTNIA